MDQLASPVYRLATVGPEHETAGLAGYPAHDWFAPAGTEVLSPASGLVRRFSGHDPREGPVSGPHGPFGWSIYIKADDGRDFYLTHLGSRSVTIGQRVRQGDVLGLVGNYARYGTPSHVHMGVHR